LQETKNTLKTKSNTTELYKSKHASVTKYTTMQNKLHKN